MGLIDTRDSQTSCSYRYIFVTELSFSYFLFVLACTALICVIAGNYFRTFSYRIRETSQWTYEPLTPLRSVADVVIC